MSYIVAVFNKDKFIEECIDSIVNESSDDINIEIIIVNDGSTDASWSIIKELYLVCKEVIFIHDFKENKGKVAAYNKGYELATGDYICLFGADDYLLKNRTKNMVKASDARNKSILGGMLVVNNKGGFLFEMKKKLPSIKDICFHNSVSGGGLLIRKKDAKLCFPIPESLLFEDWWIGKKLVERQLLAVIDTPVTYYRLHEGNDSGFGGRKKYEIIKNDYARHFDYLKEFLKCEKDKKVRFYLKRSFVMRKIFFGEKKISFIYYLRLDRYGLKTLLYFFGLGKYF